MHRARPPGPGRRLRLSRLFALSAPHPALWAVTVASLVVDMAWLARSPVSLEPTSVAVTAVLFAALYGAGAIWTLRWPEPTLRGMSLATAFLVAFTSTVGVLHYAAAALALPLVDPQLGRLEAALGFDWRGHMAFLDAHPALRDGLALAYHSSPLQVALVVILLSATRRMARLWAFARLFAVTLLVAVAISALAPAAGAYAAYGVADVSPEALATMGGIWHLHHLEVLRRGLPETIPLGSMRGLVTFPSFHASLAVITAWALAPLRGVGIAALLLNAAVVVATLGAGGHYLPDVIAGVLLGAAALGTQALVRRHNGRRSALRHNALVKPAPSRSA